MNSRIMASGLLMGLAAAGALAEDGVPKDGLALYNKQCSMCHGVMTHDKADARKWIPSRDAVRLALAPAATGPTRVDFAMPAGLHRGVPSGEWTAAASDRIAVAPIYGPPLQGVIGRAAGTSERYTYSKAFMAKMDGVIWDSVKLDSWIKSSQSMVPGSYMFYSQKNPEIRAKIIEYLKQQVAQ